MDLSRLPFGQLLAGLLVFVSEPDAFGLAPESWTTPHGVTYMLLGVLFANVVTTHRSNVAAKVAAVVEVTQALADNPKQAARDRKYLSACTSAGVDVERVHAAFERVEANKPGKRHTVPPAEQDGD